MPKGEDFSTGILFWCIHFRPHKKKITYIPKVGGVIQDAKWKKEDLIV